MKTQNETKGTLSVLIVEDEPHAQKELMRLLSNSGHSVDVLDCIDNIEDTIQWINQNPEPDLMFFDIQLSDGLSFEIFKQVNSKAPVIFTTAYDEYAIQAFKVNSIDYLLKPVKQDDLNTAINKYFELNVSTSNADHGLRLDQIEQLLNIHKPKFKSRFISRIGDQIKYIGIDEIAYFKAEDNDVLLITKDKQRFFIDYSLEELNTMLKPESFYRANRSYIIHISSIKKISKYFNSRMHIELIPKTKDTVLISRVKVPEFLNWIEK